MDEQVVDIVCGTVSDRSALSAVVQCLGGWRSVTDAGLIGDGTTTDIELLRSGQIDMSRLLSGTAFALDLHTRHGRVLWGQVAPPESGSPLWTGLVECTSVAVAVDALNNLSCGSDFEYLAVSLDEAVHLNPERLAAPLMPVHDEGSYLLAGVTRFDLRSGRFFTNRELLTHSPALHPLRKSWRRFCSEHARTNNSNR